MSHPVPSAPESPQRRARAWLATHEAWTWGAAPLALTVALLWPHAHGGPAPSLPALPHAPLTAVADLSAPELTHPPGPAPACGADVLLADALVDPTAVPDRDGEEVTILNRGPDPVDLAGWTLAAGRRRLTLASVALWPGEAITLGGDGPVGLGTLRLPNAGGELVLRDPCGLRRAHLRWGGDCAHPRPGWRVHAPGQKRVGPARSVTGGAEGGCGQT